MVRAPNFIQTNIVGTFTLLQEALRYWGAALAAGRARLISAFFTFRPTRSTDRWEPMGLFTEATAYCAELAIFRQQGLVGSPSTCMARKPMNSRRLITKLFHTTTGPTISPRKLIPAHHYQGARPANSFPFMATGQNIP